MNDIVTADRVRVTFNLTPQEVERLKDVSRRRGLTATEVLRKALSAQFFIYETYEGGGKLLLENERGDLRELVLI